MSRTCWKAPWGGVCLLTALIFVAKAAESKRLGLILQTHLPVQTAMPAGSSTGRRKGTVQSLSSGRQCLKTQRRPTCFFCSLEQELQEAPVACYLRESQA